MTTILVVDDSRLARDMVSSAIASLQPGWTILTAVSGDDALAKLGAEAPIAAVVDYNMPGMDGLALAGHLRDRFPGMPIGILTANVQDALRKKAEALGCRFLPKPITVDKIRGFLSDSGV